MLRSAFAPCRMEPVVASSTSPEPERVREMFGGIARRYDLLNRILSLWLDQTWRRRAARELAAGPHARVLDLCGGTGDLSIEIARAGRTGLIVCCDFSHPMLMLAVPKFRRTGFEGRCLALEADGLRLPFADETFDAVSVAFGVRNFDRLEDGLREILRVLRPGGRCVILEFSQPTQPLLARLYRIYLRHVLPRLGDRVSGHDGPYGYLARSIGSFLDPPTLAGRLRETGFAAAGWSLLSGGIVAIHTAIKGGEQGSSRPACAGGEG